MQHFTKMLPGKAIPATMLFLLFVRSGVTSPSPSVTPSPSTTNSTTPTVTPSANVSSKSSVSGANPSTPSASIMPPATASVAWTSTINTKGGGSEGGVTPSPTAAGSQTVNVTASSVADVVWHEWITEKPEECKEQCCDAGGGFTYQIRNCTINRQRCDLKKCEDYGVIRREVSCKTACDCMSSAGHLAPGLKTIIATLLICTLIVNMKP